MTKKDIFEIHILNISTIFYALEIVAESPQRVERARACSLKPDPQGNAQIKLIKVFCNISTTPCV